MVAITLPDGSVRNFDGPVTGAALAADIGPGLAKAALAVKVDGELRDLSRTIETDAGVEIVTRDHEDALELLRHDAAHVFAEAVQELFPDTQITFGPATEDGFYYDFYREAPFTPDDFEAMEKRMQEIVDRDEEIVREIWDRDAAVKHFSDAGETFKANRVKTIPAEEDISIYRQGDWLDLCTGPHLPSTGKLGKAFKLLKLAGAYWRGDANNPQLQRIYGTCWRTEKELRAYLHRPRRSGKARSSAPRPRDGFVSHPGRSRRQRILAPERLDLVPRGRTLHARAPRDRRLRRSEDPQLIDRTLWEKSGHWEKFRENMFTAQDEGDKVLALKPMNCPGHVQIFKQGIKSYRDLPLRMSEFGSCHRNEPSGALHGLMRVRAFTQDDAHIFCMESQIEDETKLFIDLLSSIYRDFGFDDFTVKFADRPEVRAGEDEVWDRAEKALMDATKAAGIEMDMNLGEGAFYGPKLEFVLRDAIGREWQCGTLQADFVLPERLDASYIGEDGERHRPVMLHRAILGSFERFLGVLIEHYAGRMPLWLSSVQAVVATITGDADAYANDVINACKMAGLRVEADLRNEKINYKVREHSLAKVPVLMVVGNREAEDRTVALRRPAERIKKSLRLMTRFIHS